MDKCTARPHTLGNLVEVYGDLKSGDEIVERGTDEIRDGSELKTSRLERSLS